jgi:hypothetical protein
MMFVPTPSTTFQSLTMLNLKTLGHDKLVNLVWNSLLSQLYPVAKRYWNFDCLGRSLPVNYLSVKQEFR